MASIKNEHIVWGYGELEDGTGQVVLVGLTDTGLKYLANNKGMTLTIEPPMEKGFANVRHIIIYAEKDKVSLKETLRKGGAVIISEAN